jgi:ABC-type transport system involved in multi-copper enzyme maturation permease subunit
MKITALLIDTLRELTGKVTLVIMLVISTLFILGTLAAFSAHETPDGVILSLFGKELDAPVPRERVEELVVNIQSSLTGGMITGVVLFGVFATAGLIPSMLEKGIADLYLSKPLARWELLLGKYLGAVTAILIASLYFLIAILLIFGIRAGVWNFHLLAAAPAVALVFTAIYAVALFVGTLTASTPLAIIGAYFYLFFIAGLLENRVATLFLFSENGIYRGAWDGLYYLFPQIPAMRQNVSEWIVHRPVVWTSFLQSAGSAVLFFLGASALLQRKDF